MARQSIDSAPPLSDAGRHAMSPETGHDDIARFNFLANFNKYMSAVVVAGNAVAWRDPLVFLWIAVGSAIWVLSLYETANLWDALIDPVAAIGAVLILAGRGLRRLRRA